ncbi:unnamed protein product [Didymodactylos carnosus]|uniref:DUF5648 domain-containing protein n=1 Tax=Didymodactylos carnosus TaxID=1234261 RepID=A0A815WJ11_9BILA|nr:unnamed protein product [Didymodactylos carnosus]CAF4406097.1 unnamed protein product [Didymodactylos carnosus]
MALILSLAVIIGISLAQTTSGASVPFYRYSKGIYDHFYTINAAEIGTTSSGQVGQYGYVFEGIACNVYPTFGEPNTVPLYRYVRPGSTYHFYTTSTSEIGTISPGATLNGYTCEGVAGYVYKTRQPGTCPFHRYYNSQYNQHFYTVSPCEIGVTVPGLVGKYNYKYEGIAAYVITSYPCDQNIVC